MRRPETIEESQEVHIFNVINKPFVNTFFKEFTDNRKNKNIGNRIISIIEKSTNIYDSSGL